MRRFSNNASVLTTELIVGHSGAGPVTDVTFAVDNSGDALDSFPDLSTPGDYAYVTAQNADGLIEIMKLTAVDTLAGTLTVDRGNAAFPANHPDAPVSGDGITTGMLEFAVGSRIEVRATAGMIEGMLQRNDDTVHGGVWGATPSAPDSADTILIKYTTDGTVDEADLTTLQTGELAFNAKTRKLYAGAVDNSDNPEPVEIASQVYVQSTEPAANRRTDGTFWFDTTPANMCLYVYNGGTKTLVINFARAVAALLLENDVALQSRNAADSASKDLIKLSADDEAVLGHTGLTLLKVLADFFQIEPTLRIRSTNGTNGYWQINATASGGAGLLQDVPTTDTGVGAQRAIKVKSTGDVVRQFLFDMDGFLQLPVETPTADEHAASKGYVDAQVASVNSSVFALANVDGTAGALIGTATNVASSSGSGGEYTINFDTAATSVNNLVAVATVRSDSSTPAHSYTAQVEYVSASQIIVRVRVNGNNPALSAQSFSVIVYDTGA